MAFRWLTKRSVESDDGFVVSADGSQSPEDVRIQYDENGRRMCLRGGFIYADLEGYGFGVSFDDRWRQTMWDIPHDKDPITSEDRIRIRNNVTNALAFMNGKAKFR